MSNTFVSALLRATIGLAFIGGTLLFSLAYAGDIFLPVVHTGLPAEAAFCRLGVNGTHSGAVPSVTDESLAQLRIGWYQRYRTEMTPTRPNGAEYAQTVGLRQTGPDSYRFSPNAATILQLAGANPGSMWVIGNEPDRRFYQSDIEPHLYAEVYHELYELIKAADPTARILAGSIVQATEVRLKYLDMVLAHYRQQYGRNMPVDAWSIHGFILNEVSCDLNPDPEHLSCTGAEIPPGIDDAVGLVLDDPNTPPGDWIERNDDFGIFVENILRFRNWMAREGYRDVPLLMSEFGILVPDRWYPQFGAERVNAFMNRTFDYLLTATDPNIGLPADNYRLVQRLSWYSTTDQDFNGYLFFADGRLTLMGENYRARATAMAPEVDFTALAVTANPPVLLAAQGAVTVTLQAKIGNAGNLTAPTRAVVRFFNGDPEVDGVQIGAEALVNLTGCGETQVAELVWTNVAPATYDIHIIVDPENVVQEIDERNNRAAVQVHFATNQVQLPLVNK